MAMPPQMQATHQAATRSQAQRESKVERTKGKVKVTRYSEAREEVDAQSWNTLSISELQDLLQAKRAEEAERLDEETSDKSSVESSDAEDAEEDSSSDSDSGSKRSSRGSSRGSIARKEFTPKVDVFKLRINTIVRKDAEQVQNSLFRFHALLDSLNCLEAAQSGGDAGQERILRQIMIKWVEDDEEVLTSVRQRFGSDPSRAGSEIYAHVYKTFIKPKTHGRTISAAEEFKEFGYPRLFQAGGTEFHVLMNKFWDIASRLPKSVRGDDEHWIGEIIDHAPPEHLQEFDRMLRRESSSKTKRAHSNRVSFSTYMSRAIDKARERSRKGGTPLGLGGPSLHATPFAQGKGRREGDPKPKCDRRGARDGVARIWRSAESATCSALPHRIGSKSSTTTLRTRPSS